VSILPLAAKSSAGAIFTLAEPDWLNWSQDKDDMLGLMYRLCHVTLCLVFKTS